MDSFVLSHSIQMAVIPAQAGIHATSEQRATAAWIPDQVRDDGKGKGYCLEDYASGFLGPSGSSQAKEKRAGDDRISPRISVG